MALSGLAASVQHYFEQGLAPSTQRTYKAAIKRFHDFCTRYCVFNPFPLSEQLLCHFATYLAEEGLAAQSIKIYLAAARNMHISLGFPDPRDSSSLPVLQRVQLGIQSVQASKSSTKRTRLPITLEILDRLRVLWEKTQHTERILLWAVAALCFAGFFRAGELLPSSAASAPMSHCIRWGDVSVDKPSSPSVVKVHLHVSKCDQFGKGEWMFLWEACQIDDAR